MKKGLIKWIKTGKLRYLIISTITMIVVLSGSSIGRMSEKVQTKKIKDAFQTYQDLSNIVKIILPYSYMRWVVSAIIIFIWILIIYFRLFYEETIQKPKEIIHILAHSSLGKTQFKLNEEASKTVQLTLEDLDLIEDVKVMKENYSMLQYIVTKQDSFIEKFKDKINNTDKYGYMGISHTPFILRAGYKIGDETKFVMIHKKRNVDYYEKLNNCETYPPIEIERKNLKENCTELIVAISTTFPIEDNQLNILQPENKSVLKFKSEKLGFDVITSEKQVEDYVSNILGVIRQIRGDKGITKIHMVISSSVVFTFALGQALSSNYDPEIIIYNFDINNPKKYPWGISLFKDSMNCVVVN